MLLDLLNNGMYSTAALTTSINRLPVPSTRIGDMGLFRFEGISQLTVAIGERDGKLTLVPDAARGTMPTWNLPSADRVRTIRVRHLPINDTVMADDVQGVRPFGSENTDDGAEAFQTRVNDKLQGLRNSLELTHEWHRMGALKGIVLDADGSTVLYNIFNQFGITQEEFTVNFTDDAESIKLKILDIIEYVENVLAGQGYTELHAFVGRTWWRNMLSNAEVKAAFDEDAIWRQTQQRAGFRYGDMVFEPYRGKVNGIPYVADDEAHIFPVGVPDLFMHYGAPAPFAETVNTIGLQMYSKTERMKYDVGVELHANSSPLFICTQPGVLVKATDITGVSS